jgi:uncharacterized protein YdhG (YjbR/CyaY superfamily)
MKTVYKNVNEYIDSFPEEMQKVLKRVRMTIRHDAPEAEEGISYGMPAYKTHGKPLVYFAAYKSHIGFYATPTGHAAFAEELSKYKQGKGSVQFPLDRPIPYDLIARITRFRVEENSAKSKKL